MQVAAKRAAQAGLVHTFARSAGGGGKSSGLTADDVARVVSSIDDACAQAAANVQVFKKKEDAAAPCV